MTRIYTPQKLEVNKEVVLEPQSSQHLLRVLRLKLGDSLVVFNGEGGEYHAILRHCEKGIATIEVTQFTKVNRESPLRIHLAQGISRGERMDFVIQKATELGVSTFTPLFSERCNVKLSGERLQKRLSHWKSVAISACEQSGRCELPTIAEACRFDDFVGRNEEKAFICEWTEKGDESRVASVFESAPNPVTVMIGPEGGFSQEEIKKANQNHFYCLSLGPRVLRTETAPIVVLALLQSHLGDL